jgi:hypothetical protein
LFKNRWHRNYYIRRYVYGPCLGLATRLLYGGRALIPASAYRLERPIFVVGVSGSGTTVFIERFARHRDLCNWSEAAQILDLHFYTPERDTLKDDEPLAPFDAFRMRCLFGLKTRLTGKRRFVNKHPENSLRIRYLLKAFPDAMFVHLIRESHATVESNYSRTLRDPFRTRWPFGQFPKPPKWRQYLALPLVEQFAWQWVDLIEHIRRVAITERLVESRYLEVRYEEFCANPRQVLELVDRLCGLSPEGRDRIGIMDGVVEQNQRWRTTLDTDQIARIDGIVSRLNDALGYGSDAVEPQAAHRG